MVDDAGRLVGTVSRSAVSDALLERSETESLKRQGVFGDELRSMPLFLRARRRLAWLSANIVLNVIAASVISIYEETLAAVIAIAIFLPMVSDMSGCSGNQSVAVSLRELALGLAKPVDAFRVWAKEVIGRCHQRRGPRHPDRRGRLAVEGQRLPRPGHRAWPWRSIR